MDVDLRAARQLFPALWNSEEELISSKRRKKTKPMAKAAVQKAGTAAS